MLVKVAEFGRTLFSKSNKGDVKYESYSSKKEKCYRLKLYVYMILNYSLINIELTSENVDNKKIVKGENYFCIIMMQNMSRGYGLISKQLAKKLRKGVDITLLVLRRKQ